MTRSSPTGTGAPPLRRASATEGAHAKPGAATGSRGGTPHAGRRGGGRNGVWGSDKALNERARAPRVNGPARATAPFFYLRSDETLLRKEGAGVGYAFLLFIAGAVPLTLLCLVALGLPLFFAGLSAIRPGWVGAVYVATLALVALVAWRRYATTEYALTDVRIYARTGRLVTSVHFATYDKVTDVRYRQGPLERMLGVSGLTFATAGGEVQVRGVVDALAVKETAERARDAFIQRLLNEAGIDLAAQRQALPGPADAPQPGDPLARQDDGGPLAPPPPVPQWNGPRPAYVKSGDVPAWQAKPSPAAALESAKMLLGVLPFLLLIGRFPPELRGLILLLAFGFAAVSIGATVLQLRRTEYVATDRRVYARTGLLGTTVRQLTYDKITDITYKQDLLGRIFGYGTVSLSTAGGEGGAIPLHGLAQPLQAKETIEGLRARYLREAGA